MVFDLGFHKDLDKMSTETQNHRKRLEFLYQDLSGEIIGAAIEVHKTLGPGFPERVYQVALEHELTLREIPFESQKQVLVIYKGIVAVEYFIDLIVDGKIILELKALNDLEPVHEAQAMSYLKASKLRLALLLNFGQKIIQSKRIIL